MAFDFNSIEYPAFVVVYGRSKHGITSHNRTEYEEHFACNVCETAEAAKILLEGYPGHESGLTVYAVPRPQKVVEVLSRGCSTEYDADWNKPDEDDQCDAP